ncbi:MAG: dihydroneopterin aldolase [Saprospiraceae bacterium]
MKTKISIQGAEFFAYHGFYEEERKSGHTFVLDVEVTLQSFDSQDDDIKDTVNYEMIYMICKNEMDKTHKLIETVVLNIIKHLHRDFPFISNARVRMEKIGPQLGGKVAKSVIEMES